MWAMSVTGKCASGQLITLMAAQSGSEMLALPLECRRSGSADRRHWFGCQVRLALVLARS